MKRYVTENAEIKAECPRNLLNKNCWEIVKYLQSHFKTNLNESGRPCVPANKATAYMMAVSDAIFDPSYWKNPIYAKFPQCGKEWAKAAVIWYHGTEPMESFIGVYSNGYAC